MTKTKNITVKTMCTMIPKVKKIINKNENLIVLFYSLFKVMIRTFLFVVLVTVGLSMIPNRSNFPTTIIVPVLVALLTKYTLGDWDRGFRWTSSDLLFWTSVFAISYITINSFIYLL